MVLATCRRVLKQNDDVEDAFQATFLTLVRKADSIGTREAVSGWLYQVAHRTALLARSRSVTRARHEQHAGAAPQSAGGALPDDLAAALDEEVNRLPEKYRLPVVLCYLEGKTNEEAARELGCPAGTVYTRLARARERLRSQLTRRGLALSAGGLLAALAQQAAAAVPQPLLTATVEATVSTLATNAATGASVSPRVAALTKGVLQAMSPIRW
jgi:RNA polymerase sigma factor (sigma-70 family)